LLALFWPQQTTYEVAVIGSHAAVTGAQKYAADTTVTISAGSRSGYSFSGWTAEGVTLGVPDSATTEFTMPANSVTVTANWTQVGGGGFQPPTTPPTQPPTQTTPPAATPTPAPLPPTVTVPTPAPANPFTDVKEADWFYSSVMHAFRSGLFGGTSETRFDPGMPMTRAMFAAVLARLDKADVSGYEESRFTDIAPGAWYLSAVEWAADKNIVGGVGVGVFGPDEPISREQMAVMLVNYFRHKGVELKTSVEETAFVDEGKISDWAKGSVKGIQRAGIIGGKPGNQFDPQGKATRAEVAAIFARVMAQS